MEATQQPIKNPLKIRCHPPRLLHPQLHQHLFPPTTILKIISQFEKILHKKTNAQQHLKTTPWFPYLARLENIPPQHHHNIKVQQNILNPLLTSSTIITHENTKKPKINQRRQKLHQFLMALENLQHRGTILHQIHQYLQIG